MLHNIVNQNYNLLYCGNIFNSTTSGTARKEQSQHGIIFVQ